MEEKDKEGISRGVWNGERKQYLYVAFNPLMPKRCFCTSIKFITFMLQAASLTFLTH